MPAFFYAFSALGYDSPQLMQMCLATSLATIIVTSIRSVLSHNRKGAVDWSVLRGWAAGIAVGALFGVWVAASLRSRELQAIFGILALVVALYMIFGRSHWRLGERMPTGPARWALSPSIGFLSVLMGIGGGSFGVPTMTLYGMPIHRAVATAAGFGLLIAVPSVAGFLLVEMPPGGRPPLTIGAVNLVAFGLVIAMTLITAPWGAELAHRTDAARLKRIFGVFLTLVALNMLRKALGW
ncbi:putative permease [Wenxinia marina DSM 24838]|uniref:Probable membrane transporter protein n=1 Tax=Wenxinia marina DSM 24838 TaxID=1123501 RepID=A0A0D0NM49_9RHOB|nr:putative permease [Wenxinia marina DSM 24838]